MSKNRDQLTIIAAILKAAKSGSRKTRIMGEANLNFMLLQKYLKLSILAGLLEVEDCRYKLTGRGQEFLRMFKDFEEQYNKVQKLNKSLHSERERLTRRCEGQIV